MRRYHRNTNNRNTSTDTRGGQELILVGVISALLLLAGLGYFLFFRGGNANAALPVWQIGIGADISKSMDTKEKQRCLGILNLITDQHLPRESTLIVWAYAETIAKLYHEKPRSSRDLQNAERYLMDNSRGQWGTEHHLVMSEMVTIAEEAQARGEKVALALLTDGEDHKIAETKRVAEQLAGIENVKAVLVGPVENEFRMQIEKSLEPLHKAGKLVVFGGMDVQGGVDRFRDLMNRAR